MGCSSQSDHQTSTDNDNGLTEKLAGWLGMSDENLSVDKIRALAEQKCHEGNQPACDTIVQMVGNRIAIESVSDIPTLTPRCVAGHQGSCERLAVLHAELSQWCVTDNARACATVKVGPWPPSLDVASLVDSAKLACLGRQLKSDDPTCRALENF